jgi:hypothetical protein
MILISLRLSPNLSQTNLHLSLWGINNLVKWVQTGIINNQSLTEHIFKQEHSRKKNTHIEIFFQEDLNF